MFNANSLIAALLAGAVIPASAAIAQEVDSTAAPTSAQPVCKGSQGYAESFDGRRTYLWRPQWLEGIAANAGEDSKARADIIDAAEAALKNGPYSVTHKLQLVPGASANDYASIGPYWWPDPKKKDGLPYFRRDGEVNPQRNGPEFDKDRLRSIANDMEALAIGYLVSGDERYAAHGAALLEAWFIDPETRMNPHFEFAQGIPGRVNGRGEGIIEASDLSTIVEAAGVLWPSDALTRQTKLGLRQWYADFASWMATSENGVHEMRKRNNHGMFYDFYLAHFALFAGMDGVAQQISDGFLEYRLGVQMDKQGRFIEELKRTRSWHYSHYVVDAAARIATIAECVELDLWTAELDDGRGLQTALSFLTKYNGREQEWPFPDTDQAKGRFEKMQERQAQVTFLFGRGATGEDAIVLP
ncbi:alginate lyase family protein [Erythrobacter sp. HA6-11]